jgi:hypothetical protein
MAGGGPLNSTAYSGGNTAANANAAPNQGLVTHPPNHPYLSARLALGFLWLL